jgi:predicted O-methyltransferase YrrM
MAGRDTPPHSLVSVDVAQAFCLRAAATPPGAFVEVGVYHGGTAWHLAKVAERQGRPLYLYDTFTGMPHAEKIDSHVVGDFADTSIEQVIEAIPYATCIAGVFPRSALSMGPIAFVHLDVDQYRSYKEALEYFEPKMVRGGVIWCDDMPALPSAALAINEFARRGTAQLELAEKAYLTF